MKKNKYTAFLRKVQMWKYRMRLREFGIGCQPKGFKDFEYCDKIQTGYWSYVWYSEKLSEEDASRFSMDLLGKD